MLDADEQSPSKFMEPRILAIFDQFGGIAIGEDASTISPLAQIWPEPVTQPHVVVSLP